MILRCLLGRVMVLLVTHVGFGAMVMSVDQSLHHLYCERLCEVQEEEFVAGAR